MHTLTYNDKSTEPPARFHLSTDIAMHIVVARTYLKHNKPTQRTVQPKIDHLASSWGSTRATWESCQVFRHRNIFR